MKPTATVAVCVTLAAVALALASHARADSYESFQTPSGNIYCGIGMSNTTAFADCEIRDHTWVAPPRPTPCMGAWGDRFTLRQGAAARMSCHSDTVQGPGFPVLQYGQTQSVGSITCQSQPSGVTCTDNSTGHYFRVARDNYELH